MYKKLNNKKVELIPWRRLGTDGLAARQRQKMLGLRDNPTSGGKNVRFLGHRCSG